MIASMTGYGKGEASHLSANYSVEVRSVNHRFCDVSVQTPRWLKPLDSAVKRLVQEKFERGRFDVSISVSYPEESTQRELKVDRALARSYVELFKSMKKELGLGGAVDLSLILQLRDVLKLEEKEEAPEAAWDGVSQALVSALESLRAMRETEGKALYEDMVARLRKVQALVGEIRVRQPVIVEEYRQRLRDRVAQLLPEGGLDPQRVEQEVVIFAEKSDISEELVRLESHIAEFKKLMDGRRAVGRKLDFLLQEMNREINTVASKALDTAASRAAVEVKSELEKMKQQVQNVE